MNLDRYEQGPDGSLRNTTQEPEEPVTTPSKKPDPPPSFTGTPHTAPDNSLEYQDEPDDLDEFHDYEEHEMPQVVKAPVVTQSATAASLPNKNPPAHKRTRSAPASALQKVTSSRAPGDVIVLGGPKHQRTRSLDSPQKAASSQMLRKSASTDTASRKSAKSSSQRKAAAAVGGAAVVGGVVAGGVLTSKARKPSDQEVPTNFTPAVIPDTPQSTARSVPKTVGGGDPESPMKSASAEAMSKKNMLGGSDGIGPSAINHNFTTQPKKKSIMGMSRPVFAAVSLAAAGAAGLGAWTAMTLPNLNSQVRDLEEQVDRLSKEVDRLEEENDRFQASNDQLNASIAFFDEQNELLNETAIRLDDSVDDLTDQVEELVEIK